MRLIDADKLEQDLRNYLKAQEEAAEHYNITDGTYVNLQRGVILTVLEMVQAQPEFEQWKVAKWYRNKGVQLSEE